MNSYAVRAKLIIACIALTIAGGCQSSSATINLNVSKDWNMQSSNTPITTSIQVQLNY